MAQCVLIYLGLLYLLAPGSQGFSLGAPDSVCQTMMPGHRDRATRAQLAAQNDTSPYSISSDVDQNVVAKSQTVKVSIGMSSPDPEMAFRGFLLAAVGGDGEMHGQWQTTNDTVQRLACSGKAITHINPKASNNGTALEWTDVSVHWVAPDYGVDGLVFKATVVKNFSTFYMDIMSPSFRANPACRPLVTSSLIGLLLALTLAVKHVC